MTELCLSIGEPFTSPAWGSNFTVFSGGVSVPEKHLKDYMRRACKYAKKFEVYLVPERFRLGGAECMCLISPEGRVLGIQQALYRNMHTRATGEQGDELQVFSTEFGGICLCVDVDIYRPEVARLAEGMGAQYIICQQELADTDYNSSMVITGAWNAAQTIAAYVIACAAQFSCVCAPIPCTRHADGFIATPTLKTPLTAKLTVERLAKRPVPYRLTRKFYAVHRSDLTGEIRYPKGE